MIEVLFTPAEFEALKVRDLSRTVCVVFDVLRATSSIVTALAHGAAGVIPVRTIEEAVELKRQNRAGCLAGEREGFRITAQLTGSIDFDFGNSPREFRSESIRGQTIAMTTTNGTRALHACRGAQEILAAAFLNLSSVAAPLRAAPPENLLLVCSGTHEEASYEDLLGAGALAEALWDVFSTGHVADSAQVARNIYRAAEHDLAGAMQFARNGRRLLGIPELREDVPYCLERDKFDLVARMDSDGTVRRIA